MRMTTEEAFVKVLQMHGIEHAFGIIGSAMMPISDLFPRAGIKFWDCAHECTAGMIADGYTRASGKMSMAIAQNGPGITNFVTPIKTAYWNHTPMLLVTPQAANKSIGQGGFQEMEQMALFEDCVAYQEEVRDASRIAEVLNRVIENARRRSAPAQINVPRDFWTQVIDVELPQIIRLERAPGGERAVAKAAELMSNAEFPVILNGAGVVLSGAIDASRELAERLDAPVACNYQHNDAFPGSHPLSVGPLGYNGSKAAMEIISKADVVLALGTRLNPFSTLPGYGIDYWPRGAKVIQVEVNPDRIGLTKRVDVAIQGDARLVAEQIVAQLSDGAGDKGRQERRDLVAETKSRWAQELSSMDHEEDTDEGVTWNERARERDPDRMSPRQAWRAIMAALPENAIISTDIGNNCAIGNAYPTFEQSRKYLSPGLFGPCGYGLPAILGAKIGCPDVPVVGFAGDGAFGISMNEMTACGRGEWPPITMMIFRNYQWGRGEAEHDAVVRRQLRRHRAQRRRELREGRRGLRAQGRAGHDHGRADRGAAHRRQGADGGRRDHLRRGRAEPGAGRALPPRRDEEARPGRGHRPRRHAAPGSRLTARAGAPRARPGPPPPPEPEGSLMQTSLSSLGASARAAPGFASQVGPGLAVAAVLAVAAQFLSDHYGAPAMLMALLLGIAFHFLAEEGRSAPGVAFTSRTVLRIGVALLGARISVELLVGLGWSLIALTVLGVVLTIGFALLASKLLGRGWRFALLTGGSVAICGASAAMAIAAVLPRTERSERDLIFTVLAVTVLSTLAMIAYPIVADLAELDPVAAGVFLGATIHDVAQVVGAGFSISEEVGETATLVKLIRVTMLAPGRARLRAFDALPGGRGRGAGRQAPPAGAVLRADVPRARDAQLRGPHSSRGGRGAERPQPLGAADRDRGRGHEDLAQDHVRRGRPGRGAHRRRDGVHRRLHPAGPPLARNLRRHA